MIEERGLRDVEDRPLREGCTPEELLGPDALDRIVPRHHPELRGS